MSVQSDGSVLRALLESIYNETMQLLLSRLESKFHQFGNCRNEGLSSMRLTSH